MWWDIPFLGVYGKGILWHLKRLLDSHIFTYCSCWLVRGESLQKWNILNWKIILILSILTPQWPSYLEDPYTPTFKLFHWAGQSPFSTNGKFEASQSGDLKTRRFSRPLQIWFRESEEVPRVVQLTSIHDTPTWCTLLTGHRGSVLTKKRVWFFMCFLDGDSSCTVRCQVLNKNPLLFIDVYDLSM